MVRFRLDPDNLPILSKAERARLDGMTNIDIEAAAKADTENPPMTHEELALMVRIANGKT